MARSRTGIVKTVFATEWLRFLGYIIGHTATFADPKKVAVIKDRHVDVTA
jgi:hypothetical protein